MTAQPVQIEGETIADFCKRMEAFETERWAIEAILEVELTTHKIFDPCAGTGLIPAVCEDRGLTVTAFDLVEWQKILPDAMKWQGTIFTADFFNCGFDLSNTTVMMNPPFSLAQHFVDHALKLGARKVICFQRHAWRESKGRRGWWEKNPPSRIWVCGERATCWRFDLLDCQQAEGMASCLNAKLKGKKLPTPGCQHCMSSAPTAHSWFVWERGHKGAEITSAIYPPSTKSTKEKERG